jgi:hypothetical protein
LLPILVLYSPAKEERGEKEEKVARPPLARKLHNLEVPKLVYNFPSDVFIVS